MSTIKSPSRELKGDTLRALAVEKIKAGTAQRFDLDLDGRNGPHIPQRLNGAALSPEESHWVLGVWCGRSSPWAGEHVLYQSGETRLEDPVMVPLVGDAKRPEPGARLQYVMAEIVDPVFGEAVVVGATKNKDYAVRRTAQYERGEVTVPSLEVERWRSRGLDRGRGIEMDR